MRKRVTVKDIAKALDVSVGTVDRALNNRPGIKEETRVKVISQAKEMGYEANRIAQSLSRKQLIKIGCVFPHGFDFYPAIEAGISAAYKDLVDFNVQVICMKTNQLGYEEEIKHMRKLLDQGVQGIALCPGHHSFLNPEINRAVECGVPVVTIATDAPKSKRLTCVSTDSFNNGQIAGGLMANFVNHRGQVAVMTGWHHVTDHRQKVDGFLDVVTSSENIMEVVGIYETQEREDVMYQTVSKVLVEYPDLKGIYINTSNSVHACKALFDHGKAGKVYLIGTDLFRDNIWFLQHDVMQAVIFQDPFMQGYKAVQILFEHITMGKSPGLNDFVTPAIITKHNIHYYQCYC